MENKNLLFMVQPSEVLYTQPMKTMKTYMNRFVIDEDDQVRNNLYFKNLDIKFQNIIKMTYLAPSLQ